MPAKYGLATQPRVSHGGCSSCSTVEGEAVCCVLHGMSSLGPRPSVPSFLWNGRCLRLLLSVWMSPAVACFPTGGVCRRMSSLSSASEVTALLQGEEDGRPGTVVLSNPADWQG